MPEYCLSQAAEQDLLQITLFGIEQFGEERARTYFNQLVNRLELIATHPDRYRKVDHIRPGYRRSVCGIHSIYYRLVDDRVEVIRILGRQNTKKALRTGKGL